jgi:hypothetical protein
VGFGATASDDTDTIRPLSSLDNASRFAAMRTCE